MSKKELSYILYLCLKEKRHHLTAGSLGSCSNNEAVIGAAWTLTAEPVARTARSHVLKSSCYLHIHAALSLDKMVLI